MTLGEDGDLSRQHALIVVSAAPFPASFQLRLKLSAEVFLNEDGASAER